LAIQVHTSVTSQQSTPGLESFHDVRSSVGPDVPNSPKFLSEIHNLYFSRSDE
jgi:hypothetical protein